MSFVLKKKKICPLSKNLFFLICSVYWNLELTQSLLNQFALQSLAFISL